MQLSISTSEDGTDPRWPLVALSGTLAGNCSGGATLTFQEWVDAAGNDYYRDRNEPDMHQGLCYNGWLYTNQGILTKTSTKISNNILRNEK